MNIRSLNKHGGELSCFISTLKTHFDVIVLCEIGARNPTAVMNLFENYQFLYVDPESNNFGGVGVYSSNEVSEISINDDYNIHTSCDCSKCAVESLFMEFIFHNTKYILGGVYRHPNGNITHFVSDLQNTLLSLDKSRTAILAGDYNIDIIKFENEKNPQLYYHVLIE